MAMLISTPLPDSTSRPPRRTSPISFFGLSVFRLYLLILFVATVPMVTHAALTGNIMTGCATSYDPALDYFPDKIAVTEAEDFSIQYFKNYKLVKNIRTKEQFALYQCGTPAPTSLTAGTKLFPVPLSSLALTQTVELSFVEMLGLRTKVKFVSDPIYFTSPCIQKMVLASAVSVFDKNSTIRAQQYDQVEGVIVFGANPANNKTISSSVTSDPGALHRAEWIGFIASFFNMEAKANSIFKDISARFDCISELAATSTSNPKVAWVSYNAPYSYGGVTYPASYQLSKALYKQDYIKSLGASPVTATTEYFSNLSDWKVAVADADIVIDETYGGDYASFLVNFELTSSSNFKFIRNSQVWGIDKLQNDFGFLDWFEGAVANPDTVLQDLLTILKPDIPFTHKRVWFRHSSANETASIEGAKACPDYSVPMTTRSALCALPSSSPAGILVPSFLVNIFGFFVAAFLARSSFQF